MIEEYLAKFLIAFAAIYFLRKLLKDRIRTKIKLNPNLDIILSELWKILHIIIYALGFLTISLLLQTATEMTDTTVEMPVKILFLLMTLFIVFFMYMVGIVLRNTGKEVEND